MKILFMILTLISTSAHAFTLNNNFGASFKRNNVKVYVDELTTCDKIEIPPKVLKNLVNKAVNNFWNEVPTSALRLSAEGFSPATPNLSEGRLCSPTDDECIQLAGADVIPPVQDIIIGCNNNDKNFKSLGVLAVTIPNNFTKKRIEGAVILLNNRSGSAFKALSESDKISVLAHEIGHAIGLGHAEDNHKEALMYYRVVKLRKNLAQDDIDGVSYLYPVKLEACGLFSASVDDQNSKSPPFWQMGAALALLISLFEIKKLLRRPKTRSPA